MLGREAASAYPNTVQPLEVAEPSKGALAVHNAAEEEADERHTGRVRAISMILALCFHSFLEGLAVGLNKSLQSIVLLFVSILIHKTIIAFSVGLQLVRSLTGRVKMMIALICLLAFMSPIGITTGILANTSEESEAKDIALIVLQGAAVGTFLFITFMEVLPEVREDGSILSLPLMLIGFGVVAGFRAMDAHDEAEHGHDGVVSALCYFVNATTTNCTISANITDLCSIHDSPCSATSNASNCFNIATNCSINAN